MKVTYTAINIYTWEGWDIIHVHYVTGIVTARRQRNEVSYDESPLKMPPTSDRIIHKPPSQRGAWLDISVQTRQFNSSNYFDMTVRRTITCALSSNWWRSTALRSVKTYTANDRSLIRKGSSKAQKPRELTMRHIFSKLLNWFSGIDIWWGSPASTGSILAPAFLPSINCRGKMCSMNKRTRKSTYLV